MKEAEVILRMAMYYIKNNLTSEHVNVSIDGAHVKTGDTVHFDIVSFLKDNKLIKIDNEFEKWQGEYSFEEYNSHIIISSTPGIGDVNIKHIDGSRIYIECKKGKEGKRGSEYPLMREALGQLITGCDVVEGVIPMVAVPYTEKSKELAERWSRLTQIKNLGIKFALVYSDGNICIV